MAAAPRTRTVLIVVSLLMACGEQEPADNGEVGATDACGPVQTIPIQGEGHLVGGQEPPVAYNSTPPTSGWHTAGDVEFAVYGPDDVLTEPEQVTVLELGGALITYHGLADNDVAALEQLVTDAYAGRAAMTPYDQLDQGQVGLTAWGKIQLCDGVDEAAIAAFIEAYAEPAG